MKKIMSTVTAIVLLVVLIVLYMPPVSAQNPGDATDPLVTRSYVDARVSDIQAELESLRAVVDFMMVDMAYTINNLQPLPPGQGTGNDSWLPPLPPSDTAGDVVPFTALQVRAGYSLIAEAGVEFILRSGLATALSGPDGMVNVTAGRDVINGDRIPPNNLLLVPRSDGRGFVAEADTWVMIKGGFEIVNNN